MTTLAGEHPCKTLTAFDAEVGKENRKIVFDLVGSHLEQIWINFDTFRHELLIGEQFWGSISKLVFDNFSKRIFRDRRKYFFVASQGLRKALFREVASRKKPHTTSGPDSYLSRLVQPHPWPRKPQKCSPS